jgi:hypothetical protein
VATKVLPCDCTGITEFKVKSAGDRSGFRWIVPVPFYNRNNGARFQDAQYGLGRRIHNVSEKDGNKSFCTVCGKLKG